MINLMHKILIHLLQSSTCTCFEQYLAHSQEVKLYYYSICHFFPDVLFQIQRCPWYLFIHLALEISSEEEVLRLGTLVPMIIEVPTKYPLSQDRIVVFEICLHSKSPMLCRPALHGNWNSLSFARSVLKDKFLTPTFPLTTVLPNRQVLLLDPVCDQINGQVCTPLRASFIYCRSRYYGFN